MVITVSANETPVVTISTPNSSVCPGSNVTFTSAATYTGTTPGYSWKVNGRNTGVYTPTFTYTPANNDAIQLSLTSDYPCLSRSYVLSDPIIITVDTPAVPAFSITGGNSVTHLESLTLSANVTNVAASMLTYQWSVNGVNVPGANSATFTYSNNYNNNDVVCCTIFSTNECGTSARSTQCETITVNGNLGVSQATTGSDIRVVPNPNTGTFTIKGTTGTTANDEIALEVTNMLGQVVYSGKTTAQNGVINEVLALNNLANGMYLLNVHSGTETNVFHFVIEQ